MAQTLKIIRGVDMVNSDSWLVDQAGRVTRSINDPGCHAADVQDFERNR
jgi:hypothetical protein